MSDISKQNPLSIEIEQIKNSIEILDEKINQIIAKLDEFTIMVHEGDIDEEDEDDYNNEWSPYADDDSLYDDDLYDDNL